MQAPGLGHVVRRLLLGEIGNVAGHGGGDDEAAGAALLEVVADGLGAVEGAVEVGLDDLVPGLDGAVEDAAVGGAAGVGDEGVDFAELGDDGADEFGHIVVAADVEFVRLALDAVFFRQFFGVLFAAFRARRIGYGQVGAHFGAASGGFDAHAFGAGGAGHDDDFAFEAEQVH